MCTSTCSHCYLLHSTKHLFPSCCTPSYPSPHFRPHRPGRRALTELFAHLSLRLPWDGRDIVVCVAQYITDGIVDFQLGYVGLRHDHVDGGVLGNDLPDVNRLRLSKSPATTSICLALTITIPPVLTLDDVECCGQVHPGST